MERSVEVRILVSHWAHTSPKLRHFMKAIRTLHGVNGASLRIVRSIFSRTILIENKKYKNLNLFKKLEILCGTYGNSRTKINSIRSC